DIGGLRGGEEALRQSEAESRRLLEFHDAVMANMGEGLYAVDAQGFVTYMNPAAERLFGWTNAELLGQKMHDRTHYRHPDGRPFPIEEFAGFHVLHEGKALNADRSGRTRPPRSPGAPANSRRLPPPLR